MPGIDSSIARRSDYNPIQKFPTGPLAAPHMRFADGQLHG